MTALPHEASDRRGWSRTIQVVRTVLLIVTLFFFASIVVHVFFADAAI